MRQGSFVEDRYLRGVDHHRARVVGFAECCRDVGPELTRANQPVSLVLEIVSGDHGLGCEQTSDRFECLWLEPTFRKPTLERIEQVGGRHAALRNEFAGQVRAVDEAGKHRVDGPSPAVRGEVRCRNFVDPPVASVGLEPVGQVVLVVGESIVAQQPGGQRVAR